MVALCNRAGHYIFALWFLSSIYLLLFSSPNFSGRRLDVYHTSAHGVALVRLTNGWELLASLGHPCKFQRLSRLGSVTAWHSSSGRQPNLAALNRGHHLYSEGRPSRWALAHILVTHICCLLYRRFCLSYTYRQLLRGITTFSAVNALKQRHAHRPICARMTVTVRRKWSTSRS